MSEATSDSKERPLMTIRVSHDSGKTWGRVREYRSDKKLAPLMSGEWPLCRCYRCGGRDR